MPFFVVLMHGSGIDVPADGAPSVGFYTSRSVHAVDESRAQTKARATLLAEWSKPPYASCNRGNLPEIQIESVRRHAWWQHFFFPNAGHTFYAADEVTLDYAPASAASKLGSSQECN